MVQWRSVWISSRREGRRQTISGQKGSCTLDRAVASCLENVLREHMLVPPPVDSVLGLCAMRPKAKYHHQIRLSPLERKLADLWDAQVGLAHGAYVWEIEGATAIEPTMAWSTIELHARCGAFWFSKLAGDNWQRFTPFVPQASVDLLHNEAEPNLAIRLPCSLAALVCAGLFRLLVLPDCREVRVGWRPSCIGFWSRRSFPRVAGADDAAEANVKFHVGMAKELAEELRGTVESLSPASSALERRQCALRLGHWVNRLQNAAAAPWNADARRGARGLERARHFIRCVVLAEYLARKGSLLDVLKRTVRTIFCAEECEHLIELLNEKTLRVFDKSEISRGHLTVDVAFMLLMRARNATDITEGCVRYLLIDSSPQYERDYEIVLMKRIRVADMQSLMARTTFIFNVWRDRPEGSILEDWLRDSDLVSAEEAAIDEVRQCVAWHVFPAVQVGFGAAGVFHKLHAIAHALRLEVKSHEELMKFWNQVVCICSDYGTEFNVPFCRPVADLFPWWRDASRLDEEAPPDPLEFPVLEEDMLAPRRADMEFSHVLPNDGLLHTIDNCTQDLSSVMPGYKLAIRKLKSVAKLVRSRGSKDKLIQRCFSDHVTCQFANAINQFRATVYLKRWGTVAFAIPEMLKLQVPLRYAWDLRKYRLGAQERPADESEFSGNEAGLQGRGRAEVVDLAIRDRSWWAYLRMLEQLAFFLRQLHHWAEWCPCHGDLVLQLDDMELDDAERETIRNSWAKCPLRGCRAPCLAAGEFLKQVDQLGNVTAANLLLGLPAELTHAERQSLLMEFNQGRSHIQFYFEFKLHHWMEPPWVLYKFGHFDQLESLHALERCLDSADPHPMIRALRDEPFRTEIAHYIDGTDINELENLRNLAVTLRFAWTAERWVEVDPCSVNSWFVFALLFVREALVWHCSIGCRERSEKLLGNK